MLTLSSIVALLLLGWLTLTLLQQWSVTGISGREPLRTGPGPIGAATGYYIESQTPEPFSCSFIEFDECGDYLLFDQHQAAWQRVEAIANAGPILLVFYCHGWRNNSQSGNVLEFNGFLRKLAATPHIRDSRMRVHGVYLGWRGNPYKSQVNGDLTVGGAFAEPIVSEEYHCQLFKRFFGTIGEVLTYWNRLRTAAHMVAGTAIARSIFQLTYTAKRSAHAEQSRVVVMGHSMGAMLLERALGQATVGQIAEAMPWYQPREHPSEEPAPSPLPFDLVLFVNSAAPALYAKMLRDYLAAYSLSQIERDPVRARRPLVISLTSSADAATGKVHPIGNWYVRFRPGLWRRCCEHLFPKSSRAPGVRQYTLFDRTPGHHPLLVSYWITRATGIEPPPDVAPAEFFAWNLTEREEPLSPLFTRMPDSKSHEKIGAWKITPLHEHRSELERTGWFSSLGPHRPKSYLSAYWVMRCDGDIMSGHNDYWNDTVTDLYAALYREVKP